jgi:hypothetical protein
MGASAVKKAPQDSSQDEERKPALRVEHFELSEAIKEAIKINLQIAKNASTKK